MNVKHTIKDFILYGLMTTRYPQLSFRHTAASDWCIKNLLNNNWLSAGWAGLER